MNEISLTGESMNIVADNIEKLKQIFPDVFCENKIDFEKLQEVLGSYVEDKQERYNFTWNGKSKALRLSQTPSTGTLRPCIEESKNWGTTENLYIEGDNLEVLKLLQKTYHRKIKMIYIDPPYNTGGDFVYPDNFADNLQNYLEITGQKNIDGNMLSSNSESSGRYHSNWLNMIYPRLRLARNLLTDDGVIYISIDDHEVENLKKVCNEIFGEENFLSCITRSTGTPTGGGNSSIVNELDYILVYAKNYSITSINGLPMTDEDMKIYDQNDEHGRYLIRPLRRTGGEDRREDRPSMFFSLTAPDGTEVFPYGPTGYESRWICGKATYEELVNTNRIFWKKTELNGENKWSVYQKFYVENRTKAPGNLWTQVEGNKKATRDCRSIFNDEKIFDYPKPIEVMKKIMHMTSGNDYIVLDFFSGSGTTAHACMQLNAEDCGKRKFIMVQLPEPCDKGGYKNICEIGKERIRRAGNKIKEEIELGNQQLKLAEEPKKIPDIGFKVLKLDSSNIKKWNPSLDDIEDALQQSLLNFVEGRTELDMVYEIMLKYGIDLTYPIETIDVSTKKVYSIGFGQLMICLDDNITTDIAQAIIEHKKNKEVESMVVVFKDNGFKDDSAKTNIKEILKVADIKDFVTV